MQAITRISILTSFALVITAIVGSTDADACPRGGYVRSYSYGPTYGYGGYGYSRYGYNQFQKTTVVKPGNTPDFQPNITPAPVTPGPSNTVAPAPAAAPSAGPAEVTPSAAPASPTPIAPGPAAANSNNVQLRDAAPVAANTAPVNPNQTSAQVVAP